MISQLTNTPVAPEYTRLLAMLDCDPHAYRTWLRANTDRLMEIMYYHGVSPDRAEEASSFLRSLFIHEHWSTT